MRPAAAVLAFASLGVVTACRDLSSFTTSGDSYEGPVVQGDFVRVGVTTGTRACLTLDMGHLQDGPGLLSTSDGRLKAEPLRPIPQIWHDPLSTLSFGEGREKNLVYVVTPQPSFAGDSGGDVFVVISLMQSGGVEVRLVRGAPPLGGASSPALPTGDGGAAAGPPSNVFAVFLLDRATGPCTY